MGRLDVKEAVYFFRFHSLRGYTMYNRKSKITMLVSVVDATAGNCIFGRSKWCQPCLLNTRNMNVSCVH